MASKKPAKRSQSDSSNKVKEQLGKPIYYMGIKTEGFTCPSCTKKLNKGIIYEHNNVLHCSRKCIKVELGA
jgi:hypothetical protein